MSDRSLRCGGRPLPSAHDDIRRYCGLPWPGGEPESWAYEYFDSTPTGPDDVVGPPDLLACAALHPGFGAREMAHFGAGRVESLRHWLSTMPGDVDLADAKQGVLDQLATLPELAGDAGLSLVSKVVHHKRPRLVPLFDRAVVDWYRPVTGVRGEAAWTEIIQVMRADLVANENRLFLGDIRGELDGAVEGPVPSNLRLVDIAIWMESR